MSESKTQCPLCHNFENHQAGCRIGALELELNEAREWQMAALAVRFCSAELDVSTPDKYRTAEAHSKTRLLDIIDQLRSQLTTAQQEIAELKRVIVKVDHLLRRIEETRWGHDGCCGVTFLANEARQTIDDCSAMKGTKE